MEKDIVIGGSCVKVIHTFYLYNETNCDFLPYQLMVSPLLAFVRAVRSF